MSRAQSTRVPGLSALLLSLDAADGLAIILARVSEEGGFDPLGDFLGRTVAGDAMIVRTLVILYELFGQLVVGLQTLHYDAAFVITSLDQRFAVVIAQPEPRGWVRH